MLIICKYFARVTNKNIFCACDRSDSDSSSKKMLRNVTNCRLAVICVGVKLPDCVKIFPVFSHTYAAEISSFLVSTNLWQMKMD